MGEIEPNDIVNSALEMNSDAIHNAIMSLMFTTGLDKRNIRNITINELLKAAAMCFKEDESHNIEILTNKNDDDMVLCWTFENDSKHQVIFSSPNTTRYIIKYLKHNGKYYDFDDFDELFRIKDPERNEYAQLKENYISSMFNNKKEALKDYKDIPYGLKFTPGSFQLHFKKVCNEHLDLDDSEKKELIDLFIGEAGDENKFYKEFKKDKKSILKYYERLLPYLEVEYYDINKHVDNLPIKEGNSYSNLRIKQKIGSYYVNNIKTGHKIDYDEYMRLCGIVYDLVIFYRDSKYHSFILNDESLDNYFKKAKVKTLIEDYAEEIFIVVNEDNFSVKINEIKHLIEKMGIFYVVHFDDNKLDNVFKEYLNHQINCNYGEVIVSPSNIQDIIYLCIDDFF